MTIEEDQTSKNFYKHSETGEVYAIEMLWRGGIVASAGPLDENDLKDLDSYEYTADRNDWLNENNNGMILM